MMDHTKRGFFKKTFSFAQRPEITCSGPSIKQTYSHQKAKLPKNGVSEGLQHLGLYIIRVIIQ